MLFFFFFFFFFFQEVVLAGAHLVNNNNNNNNNPCVSQPYSGYPFCDEALGLDERIDDMLARMSVEEKISQLDTTSPGVPSLGLAAYNWWSEATHGISHVNNTPETPWESNFAFPITAAMSFNRSLWRATGAQIGREARAFMNAGAGYSSFWAPVVNLAREPRWGRNIETPGEDPVLSGEYAAQFVRGFERSSLDDGAHLQASACCKHFAANSMDKSTVAGVTYTRHNFSATIDDRDLLDSYLKPFETCVRVGQVSGLMCSYNAIDGVPSCANDWLLTDTARDAWGFDGYVTSDCDAVKDVWDEHHYARTPEQTVGVVLGAGTDVDCTAFVGAHAMYALDEGIITETLVDARLRNLLRVRMRLGHFDSSPSPLDGISFDKDVCTEEAKELARDGVRQSVALLKNTARGLPLVLGPDDRVALVGPTARLAETTARYYGGTPCGKDYTTLLDALSAVVADTTYAPGVPSVSSDSLDGIPEAVELAAKARAVVLALGTDLTLAMEGRDAVNITFSAGQLALVEAIAATRDVVAVVFTATPLDLRPLLGNPNVTAVLHVGQPSVQTPGIVDVVLGLKSPAGRLVQTVYPAEYQDAISIFDFSMRPGPSEWPRPDCPPPYSSCRNGTNPGRTYRFYAGTPVLPFGFGLSYSTFEYELVRRPNVALVGQQVAFAINVTNTGAIEADDVVLGFLAPPGAGREGMPLKSLVAFDRVTLAPGQTRTVWLYPDLSAFTFAKTPKSRRLEPVPGTYRFTVGVPETREFGMGFLDAGDLLALLPDGHSGGNNAAAAVAAAAG
ncbi:hypothetical protein CTAYLR_002499 [Chrysophaeum taylorii]|uniref:Fibronectin type III-like domain-containing protein n=1 Tax=Chrysophaeum taylorii TaxID=2483200 RepID=A0AAD7XPY1_9STRA|nr:hypothetical protein CTAYLR_002499 [Chrysophaeum taylorii]